jgi:hypothetical protein
MNRTTSALTLLAALAMAGCANTKPATTEAPAEPVRMHSGTVTLKAEKDGCPLLVMLDPASSKEALIPIGLDDKYRKEGLQLKFSYRVSRASSGECGKGTPAILEDITVIGQVQVPKQNLPDK